MTFSYRIYYECYEQAAHFFMPALLRVTGDSEVELIRIGKIGPNTILAENIAGSLSTKNPDALFTVIKDGVEYGVLWLEISTSVETEDHDLQRFDSIIAASVCKIPFARIWARKVSRSSHGGGLDYDRTLSARLGRQRLGIATFELNWELSEDKFNSIRHPVYKACPPSAWELEILLKYAILGIKNRNNANTYLTECLHENKEIHNLISVYQKPVSQFIMRRRSTRLFHEKERWYLKFNRWDHAMDPERGMIWMYRLHIDELFIGLLIQQSESDSRDALNNFQESTNINCSSLIGSGPHQIDSLILDCVLTSPGRAIVLNCNEFIIKNSQDDILAHLVWTAKSFNELKRNPFIRGKVTKCTLVDKVDEDDVTYAVACHLYSENGFEIDRVSYPGAQGDKPFLQGNGRALLRTYFDVVALKRASPSSTIVALTESKGSRTVAPLISDAVKVQSWKDDNEKRSILLASLNLSEDTLIHTSVAYPAQVPINFEGIEKLSFFITITDGEWVIWPRAGIIPKGISILTGKFDLFSRWQY